MKEIFRKRFIFLDLYIEKIFIILQIYTERTEYIYL